MLKKACKICQETTLFPPDVSIPATISPLYVTASFDSTQYAKNKYHDCMKIMLTMPPRPFLEYRFHDRKCMTQAPACSRRRTISSLLSADFPPLNRAPLFSNAGFSCASTMPDKSPQLPHSATRGRTRTERSGSIPTRHAHLHGPFPHNPASCRTGGIPGAARQRNAPGNSSHPG